MEFRKYQHIERLETDETLGIQIGLCYVFPKIDGTNSTLWWNDGLQAGSRNRHLTIDYDNQGFLEWAKEQEQFEQFFKKYPELRLYGEWLVPHTLRTYEETAWQKFYVFDVYHDNYLPYETYKKYLDEFGIEYIPPICRIKNPTTERLIKQLEKNGYLIQDGHGVGEGIVIKNYEYQNKFGRQIWAKIVKNDFKAKHSHTQVTDVKETISAEDRIIEKFVTPAFVEKEFTKIKNEQGWSSKKIPMLFGVLFHTLITEEAWNIVKTLKYPTVNFRRLEQMMIMKIKQVKPELF